MKEVWFNYVLANKKLWNSGMTRKRIEKVREDVLTDPWIMFDLLKRHSAETKTPEQMKKEDAFMYNHCIGNFVQAISDKIREQKQKK